MTKPITRPDRRTRQFRSGVVLQAKILEMAKPGELLPMHREIGAAVGRSRSCVCRHIEQLRDDWRLVTKHVAGANRGVRVLVLEVRP